MDYSPPGSYVHGILQARILGWVAIPFSRGPSQPRDWTQVSCTAGRFFTVWAGEAHLLEPNLYPKVSATSLPLCFFSSYIAPSRSTGNFILYIYESASFFFGYTH